ncbi:MAG: hypothetical protein KME11_00545 [Timaviella obliquedivisa GSE-PSE-MK23-08B]|jgi:hypothetical protein|nr:hypothetical protein [Timaviella obliquedivisa GSE-PSE-MK23-08B]
MNALLQQVLNNIDQLTPEEQWQVMSHVMDQLKPEATQPENHSAPQTLTEARERARKVLISTRGSWGSRTPDEIDAELDRQRREDWGE